MIIRKEGIVVGMLEDSSLVLETDSAELKRLVDDWRKNGLEMLFNAAPGEDLKNDEEDADGFHVIEFTTRNLDIYENELLKEGFEVQTE